VITAAALRHGVHVHGGISREEIREDAPVAVPAVVLVMIIFRRNASTEHQVRRAEDLPAA
jgi:hypothetical protein